MDKINRENKMKRHKISHVASFAIIKFSREIIFHQMPVIRTMEFHMDSCTRGYHVYKEVWTAVFGEELYTEREFSNVVDCYAVTVMKDSGETVGHLLRLKRIIEYSV